MTLSKIPEWAVLFRLSLRELFVLVALVALATVSLKYASEQWLALIAAITMVVCFAALIVAVVDRGSRQAFAIGFSLVAVGYTALLIGSLQKDAEYNFSSGRMPTTLLLRNMYFSLRTPKWTDPNTLEPMSNDEALAQRSLLGANSGGRRGSSLLGANPGGPRGNGPYLVNYPKESAFMPLGQCWWTLALAYVGGRFARHVYVRRQPPSVT
jgi:hypothetical protein